MPQAGDTLYTEERAMDIYDREPERALRIIDSAEVVGNVSDFRATLLRARVYAYSGDAMNLDTARQMGMALLQHDSVKGCADSHSSRSRFQRDEVVGHASKRDEVVGHASKRDEANRMEVLRLLTDVARVSLDYPEQMKWASELATLAVSRATRRKPCARSQR